MPSAALTVLLALKRSLFAAPISTAFRRTHNHSGIWAGPTDAHAMLLEQSSVRAAGELTDLDGVSHR